MGRGDSRNTARVESSLVNVAGNHCGIVLVDMVPRDTISTVSGRCEEAPRLMEEEPTYFCVNRLLLPVESGTLGL